MCVAAHGRKRAPEAAEGGGKSGETQEEATPVRTGRGLDGGFPDSCIL